MSMQLVKIFALTLFYQLGSNILVTRSGAQILATVSHKYKKQVLRSLSHVYENILNSEHDVCSEVMFIAFLIIFTSPSVCSSAYGTFS